MGVVCAGYCSLVPTALPIGLSLFSSWRSSSILFWPTASRRRSTQKP
jgi:hypothetical protein